MKTFDYIQSTASAVWTINHNLGAYASSDILVLNNGVLQKALPLSIVQSSSNQLVITFTSPFAGGARLFGGVNT
jgi:hypothetical protein